MFSTCEIVIVNGLNSLASTSFNNWCSSILILTRQSWIAFGNDRWSSKRQVMVLNPGKQSSFSGESIEWFYPRRLNDLVREFVQYLSLSSRPFVCSIYSLKNELLSKYSNQSSTSFSFGIIQCRCGIFIRGIFQNSMQNILIGACSSDRRIFCHTKKSKIK